MTVSTKTQKHDTYVRLESNGTIRTADDAQQYLEHMYAEANKLGVNRILLDERELMDEEDAMDAYQVSESATFAQMSVRGFRLALISREENLEINKTWETILQNRSINLRIFLDETEGLDWLLS